MHILIVEDEPVIARRLARLTGELLADREARVELVTHLAAAEEKLDRQRCDILLLDLNLNGQDGFDLLAQAVAGPHQTIVVSANTDRALEAFEYGVADFVPKPFNKARLEKALARVTRSTAQGPGKTRILSFREGSRTWMVEVRRIRAIHGADQYAEVVLDDDRVLLHEKTLDQLEQLLPEPFMRVHRSHILNLARLVALENEPGSRYFARMENDERVPVSRTKIASLRQRLE